MSDTVMVAVIGLIGSGIGSLLGVIASSRLTQYRIEQLEKKVQVHNNLIDRMYRVEAHEQRIDGEIERIDHAIELLEKNQH